MGMMRKVLGLPRGPGFGGEYRHHEIGTRTFAVAARDSGPLG